MKINEAVLQVLELAGRDDLILEQIANLDFWELLEFRALYDSEGLTELLRQKAKEIPTIILLSRYTSIPVRRGNYALAGLLVTRDDLDYHVLYELVLGGNRRDNAIFAPCLAAKRHFELRLLPNFKPYVRDLMAKAIAGREDLSLLTDVLPFFGRRDSIVKAEMLPILALRKDMTVGRLVEFYKEISLSVPLRCALAPALAGRKDVDPKTLMGIFGQETDRRVLAKVLPVIIGRPDLSFRDLMKLLNRSTWYKTPLPEEALRRRFAYEDPEVLLSALNDREIAFSLHLPAKRFLAGALAEVLVGRKELNLLVE